MQTKSCLLFVFHAPQLELGAPAKYVNSLPEPQPLMIDKTTGEVVRSPLDRLGRQMEVCAVFDIRFFAFFCF